MQCTIILPCNEYTAWHAHVYFLIKFSSKIGRDNIHLMQFEVVHCGKGEEDT
jgi:hypothetical protein